MKGMACLALLCATALPLRADTLADVKAAVNRLTARQPVRATFTTQSSSKTSGRWANNDSERSIAVEVAHDAAGLTVSIPQQLLDKAAQESRTRNGAWNNPTRNAISSLGTMTIADALDFRDELIGLLNIGTPAGERRVVFQGRPVRLLVLTLSQPLTKREGVEFGSVKHLDDRLNLWIGDDYVPLAAERTTKMSAGFLMFHGESTRREVLTFARKGDRLILVRHEESNHGSGMGQDFEGSSVATVVVH